MTWRATDSLIIKGQVVQVTLDIPDMQELAEAASLFSLNWRAIFVWFSPPITENIPCFAAGNSKQSRSRSFAC